MVGGGAAPSISTSLGKIIEETAIAMASRSAIITRRRSLRDGSRANGREAPP